MKTNNETNDNDPELESLLDDALSAESTPGGVPHGLNERIIAKTAESLPDRNGGVVARIGPRYWLAAAAMIVLAAAVGITIIATINDNGGGFDEQQVTKTWNDVENLFADSAMTDDLDSELELLAMEIAQLADGTTWTDEQWSLDADLTEYELQYGNGTSSTLF